MPLVDTDATYSYRCIQREALRQWGVVLILQIERLPQTDGEVVQAADKGIQ